eukprot:CAMPEP_0116940586 /NCGR_PEP_ID=MMETSP0467-20121206/33460_1 /TAXON_ID=283647 /ORGANISM="Mesodinium pulex, Strain SPMC105" /LENGTH=79 /DNA_ID=CAMNT_0004623165 /DNA_START=1151 /DNA_END=1390 /DNA_ORIENTATION=+
MQPFNDLEAECALFKSLEVRLKHLQVAGRNYMLFAQSASQLRTSSCFMIDKDCGQSFEKLYNFYSEFDEFKTTFKANAR